MPLFYLNIQSAGQKIREQIILLPNNVVFISWLNGLAANSLHSQRPLTKEKLHPLDHQDNSPSSTGR